MLRYYYEGTTDDMTLETYTPFDTGGIFEIVVVIDEDINEIVERQYV